MELMIFSMVMTIVVVLMTYLFTEQSVLWRTGWTDRIEDWQAYYDATQAYYDATAQIKALDDELDAELQRELEEPTLRDLMIELREAFYSLFK
jgi:hypothetical protein